MPIVMTVDPKVETMFGSGALYPMFVCDECGRRITRLVDGVFLNDGEALHAKGDTTEILFAHADGVDDEDKPVDRCHSRLERRIYEKTGRKYGWEHLGHFIPRLAYNTTGGIASAGRLFRLIRRDVWLLRWLGDGARTAGLAEQPKPWRFELADAISLARRLESGVLENDSHRAIEDDLANGAIGEIE